MHPVSLNDDGTIKEIFKPGIYLDSNFLRYYFNSEGAEYYFDENGNDIKPPWEEDNEPRFEPTQGDRVAKVISDLIKPKKFIKDFGRIRHIATNALSMASLILTPINLLELYKIHAEVTFKNICADSIGVKHIQRMGDKPIGKVLTKIYEMASIEDGDETYKDLVKNCHFNTSFAAAHGLQGIFYVEEHKPQITIGDIESFLWLLSFLQLEATDISHIHSAKMLGCEYFATLDKGIFSNKEIIKKSANINVLSSPKELIETLLKYKKENV
jgi:hypothetical protein